MCSDCLILGGYCEISKFNDATNMANVMLTSEAAKDPNKPFALRVEDVCAKFDVCASGRRRNSGRVRVGLLTALCVVVRCRNSWPSV